ncbi:FecR family protein [Dyadobacter crusticola]|uniref:FecR family protein n=1 Tax=Dyadobacter crusticola TaxID=292407 RepID=UPI0004E16D67|nr:FecR family protein [Dyadobacter crusticola]
MKYTPYSLTDLIRHDAFIAWVLNPDAESDSYWKGFLEQYPEKTKTVESAREYIYLLAEDTGKSKPTEAQSSKMWKVVEDSMYVEEPVANQDEKPVVQTWRWLRVAASVALICGIGAMSFWYLLRPGEMISFGKQKAAPVGWETIEVVNALTEKRFVLLPDGSSVVLHPGSQLSYNSKLQTGQKREVTLIGKGFFEIVKDPGKPFLVYSRGIVTKVLGTSFSVDAREITGQVKVEVKTGKVTVFPVSNGATETEVSNAEKKGFILYPDQRIALTAGSGKVLKLVETPVKELNQQDISSQLFVFDETPVTEVFKSLEAAYNVKIIYNVDALEKCPLTATLVGQPFSKKLAVICNAIDATYEINGDQVRITGNGCK